MSIWNKILIGFIFIASVAFFYLSLRALKVHQYWRNAARQHETAIAKEQERRALLLEGPKSAEQAADQGIRQAMLELHKLTVDRGRVWRAVTPQKVDVTKGQNNQDEVKVALGIEVPDPHRIEVGANLVLFEERDVQDKGSYLGMFTVTEVAAKQVVVKPSLKLSARELKRLQESQDKWCVYEVVPVDDHEIFADFEELDKIIPGDSLAEYAKDGKPTDPNNKESAKFERQLRDYEVLFARYHRYRSMWLEQMDAMNRDKQYIDTGVEHAQREVESCQKDVAECKAELAKMANERNEVATHLKAVEGLLTVKKAELEQMLKRNREIAGEIARIQLEATRRIDARTQKVAQVNLAP